MFDLTQIPSLPQRQDSLSQQLTDLQAVANRLGMHDAADAIQAFHPRLDELKYGCVVELEIENEIYDTCVLDVGDKNGCIYAKNITRREQCPYWKINTKRT